MTSEERRAKLAARVERARLASGRACARAERSRSQAARQGYATARAKWLELRRELEALDAELAGR